MTNKGQHWTSKRFTDEEVSLLTEIWANSNRDTISQQLPSHPYGSILQKARKLGLRKSPEFKAQRMQPAIQAHLAKVRANPAPITLWKQLSRRIRERDNSQCQSCGRFDNLNVHHIDNDKDNNDVDNLITLCDTCHLQRHWEERGPFLKEVDFKHWVDNDFKHFCRKLDFQSIKINFLMALLALILALLAILVVKII